MSHLSLAGQRLQHVWKPLGSDANCGASLRPELLPRDLVEAITIHQLFTRVPGIKVMLQTVFESDPVTHEIPWTYSLRIFKIAMEHMAHLVRWFSYQKVFKSDPPCIFFYKIATVKLGKMVRFRALLCLRVRTQCQGLQFYRGPWCQRFYRDFMLKTGWHWKPGVLEQLEYSGQLSMNETWGIWFYRRPTNPPNLKKAWLESDFVSAIL